MLYYLREDILYVLQGDVECRPPLGRVWYRPKEDMRRSDELLSVVATTNSEEDSIEVGMMPRRAEEVGEVEIQSVCDVNGRWAGESS